MVLTIKATSKQTKLSSTKEMKIIWSHGVPFGVDGKLGIVSPAVSLAG